MRKNESQDLLYDPMPRPDAKVPPVSNPRTNREDAKRLVVSSPKEEAKDLLANLAFG